MEAELKRIQEIGEWLKAKLVSPDLTGQRLEDWCRLNQMATQIDVRMEVIGLLPEQFRDEHPLAWEVKTKGVRLV